MRKVERIDPITVDALRLRDALASALAGGPAVALTLALAPIPQDLVAEEVALLIATGGSTGKPKIVALSANAMVESARLSNQTLGAQRGDQWSLSLPFNHIAGINQLLRSIDIDSDPVKHGGQFISIVPTQLYRVLKDRNERFEELVNAKKVLIGGAGIPQQLLDQGIAAGIRLVTSYGMTEMCGGCIYDGKALPGVEVKLTDANRIALKGPMQALGYFDDDNASRESFVDGWFITSDTGKITTEGKLVVHGRADDVIISGGENISPSAVTECLQQRFPDREILVMGVPDEEWGQSLRVIMTKSAVEQDPTLAQIRDIVADGIGKVAAPRSLLLLSEMPTQPNGKIDRQFLLNTQPTQAL